MTSEKLSVREKVGFSLGDGAANFVFQTIMLLQLSFYTNTFGISSGVIAILLLVGSLVGAVSDPIMGVIADRTETRWGKFRPWILWTAIPFGIIGFLTFTTPSFGGNAKVIYAFATYCLLMMVYSANNIPYSALSGVVTGDMKQRNSLFSYRFIVVALATVAIQGFALPLVNYFGRGADGIVDSAKGYQITMGMFCGLAVLFFLTTFLTTKERIKPNPEQKSSLKEDILSLIKNRPYVIMFSVFVMMFIFLAIRNGMLIFYFRYYLDLPHMTAFLATLNNGTFGILEKIGLAGQNADVAASIFGISNIFGQIASIIGIMASNILTSKLGKRNVFIGGLCLALIFAASFYVLPPNGVALMFLLQILYNFAWGITMPVPWAMMADVADYSEWKNNRRSTAIVFAGIIIGLKIGLALGGMLSSLLLKWYGYIAPTAKVTAVAQTPETIEGIRLSTSIYPVLAVFIIIALLFMYKITKNTELQMQDELAARRKAYKS